jgi:signal transduction histidine kinase
VRPQSRFGWLLIAYGFVCAGYITQSSSNPWLFGTGVHWENLIYLGNLVLILTFPSGRLRGVAAKLILLAGTGAAALNVVLILLLPQTSGGGAISGCRELCPRNAMAITSDPALVLDLLKPFQIVVIAVAVATGGLLIWRIVTGTRPQRRALAIGTFVALLFTALQIIFLSLSVFDADLPALQDAVRWAFTAARAAVWYGFLFALIAGQLFAARSLRRLVRGSLRRPSQRELEAMLRKPLGDPGLQLRFWDSKAGAWDDAVEPESGSTVTVVERDGRPAVALIHDAQLEDDPELLQAAGAAALLAAENAELDGAWHEALRELQHSRARTSHAVDDERRRLARNLHDGAQQRLIAAGMRLALTAERVTDVALRRRLDRIGGSVQAALDEIREVSHGLYPHILSEQGLVAALEDAVSPLSVRHNKISRHPPELESAIYYCCLEAVQNATKHGGPGVSITVTLREDPEGVSFEVADDGSGFDPAAVHHGMGLQNVHDRVGALDGSLSITSARGHGTVVSGRVPLPRGAAVEGGDRTR